MVDLTGKRVLVIGSTGFIGSQLVETLLLETRATVRALVSNFAHASRLARFSDVEIIPGDIMEPSTLLSAMVDCDLIFDLAFGKTGSPRTQRMVTIQGTENVMHAASQVGVERVIYTSTISVYGDTLDGNLDEKAPHLRGKPDAYAKNKAQADEVVLRYIKNGVPAVIIQPTIVYGPYGYVWTVSPLEQIRQSCIVLPDDGNGLCNAVFIDDVINALLLAATAPAAVGETFLISGERPVTWLDFCGAYERMLGVSRVISLPRDQAVAYSKWQPIENIYNAMQLFTNPDFVDSAIKQPIAIDMYLLGRRVMPEPILEKLLAKVLEEGFSGTNSNLSKLPASLFKNMSVHFLAAKTCVKIDKAKKILGYQPAFDLEQGMALTEKWAKWADLLD